MSGRIPEQFIESLLARINVVDVINDHVPLKRAGANYTARCPFHDERTPSFTVSPEKQFYHCFGCGAHGSAIGFLMAYEHMAFVEAVHDLAARAGLTVPQESGTKQTLPTAGEIALPEIYKTLQLAQDYFTRQLKEHPQAHIAVEYLKRRGVSGQIARDFGIGYAPAGWDNLIRNLSDHACEPDLIMAAGLATRRENTTTAYDRFRDRIMFPIRDHRGRVIGFGGRVLGNDTPKYLNSPETSVFHKGKELYGLFEARKAQRELDQLIVVEGYMDVVALAQHGVTQVVATLGTAATSHHLEKLYRIVQDVVFCFDGDNAGRQAAWRALEHTLPAIRDGRQAKFMFLPDGEDPDTYVRKVGAEGFLSGIRDAPTLSQFFWNTLESKTDGKTLDGRARLAELARPYLNTVPDGVFKDMMRQELSTRTGLDRTQLSRRETQKHTPGMDRPRLSAGSPGLSAVRQALALLVHDPALAATTSKSLKLSHSTHPGVQLLGELIDFCRERPQLTTGTLLELWRDRAAWPHLEKIAQWQILTPKDGHQSEFSGALQKIQIAGLEHQIDNLLSKTSAEPGGEQPQQLRELMARLAASKKTAGG